MQRFPRLKTQGRQKRLLIGGVACLCLYTLIGFLILPLLFKWILAKKLTEQLHRQVTIEDVDVNPYVLSLTVEGFTVREPAGSETFISFDELYANLQIVSAFKRAPILKQLRMDGPYVHLVQESETRYNFSDLLAEESSESQKGEPGSGPFRFSVNNIQLLDGSIHFLDMPKDKHHQITDLHIAFPFISNLPARIDTFTEPLFSAKINGRPVSLEGKTKPFADSVETILDIALDDIDIPYYLAYLPLEWQATVLSGLLNTKVTLSYMQYVDRPPTLSVTGDVFLKTLQVVDAEERPLLKFPFIHASIARAELLSKDFHLSNILLESPEAHIIRNKEGGLSIQSMIPEDGGNETLPSQEAPPTPATVTVDVIGLSAGSFTFSDFAVGASTETEGPVTLKLEQIYVTAQDISTVENTKGQVDIACQLNGKAPFSAQGVLGITPLSAAVDTTLEGVQVGWLQPYFADYVRVMVTNGALSAAGKCTLSQSPDRGLGVRYLGQTALSDFRSADKLHADDFVKCGSLTISDMDFGHNPNHVRVKEIAFKDLYAAIIVNPDGRTNFQTIIMDKEKEEDSPPKNDQKAATPVSVENIALEGGRISFLDRQIAPNYSSNLAEINGTISGLSSEETATAEVLLQGNLDNYAPVEIKGKMNPLAEDLFVDLEVAFKDIDLSPMSPYTGKYVGQTIEKGKLFLDLKYLIENKNLDSENRLFIDQFTFGNKVESPDAVNLPVGLAVALLKDRNGEIHLDLPVSGRTDDPEFRVGKVIVQMLMNLLTKAATSPFSLLGAILPRGEEFSALEFDYGSFHLTEHTTKKLDGITAALYERPALRLDIEGHVDLEHDREAWREYLFMKKLKATKLKKLAKKDKADISLDEVTIEPYEYEKYLKKAYKAENFEKPKNVLGLAKRLPVPEMEALIRDHIDVSDHDLRLLALQRAQEVKEYILQSGEIEPERIFLVEAESLSPSKKEHVKDSRVDLKLR